MVAEGQCKAKSEEQKRKKSDGVSGDPVGAGGVTELDVDVKSEEGQEEEEADEEEEDRGGRSG